MLKVTTNNSSYFFDLEKKKYQRFNHTNSTLKGDGSWLPYLSFSEPKVGQSLEILWEDQGRLIRRSTSVITKIQEQ